MTTPSRSPVTTQANMDNVNNHDDGSVDPSSYYLHMSDVKVAAVISSAMFSSWLSIACSATVGIKKTNKGDDDKSTFTQLI